MDSLMFNGCTVIECSQENLFDDVADDFTANGYFVYYIGHSEMNWSQPTFLSINRPSENNYWGYIILDSDINGEGIYGHFNLDVGDIDFIFNKCN